jgi:hypothetical protein
MPSSAACGPFVPTNTVLPAAYRARSEVQSVCLQQLHRNPDCPLPDNRLSVTVAATKSVVRLLPRLDDLFPKFFPFRVKALLCFVFCRQAAGERNDYKYVADDNVECQSAMLVTPRREK